MGDDHPVNGSGKSVQNGVGLFCGNSVLGPVPDADKASYGIRPRGSRRKGIRTMNQSTDLHPKHDAVSLHEYSRKDMGLFF